MISVLVPVYNVEKYLRQCLDSIIAQTYSDLEIICINDGSTDESGAILAEYELEDKRIRVITQENAGYGCAMNRGLEAATGDYIGIVESDDYIDRDMYERLYEWILEDDADFVKTDYYRYSMNEDVYNHIYNDPTYDKVFAGRDETPGFLLAGGNIWTGLYKRDFLRQNRIWFLETPGASYQDISFNFKVFACARRVRICERAFYHYRVDNESASVKSKAKVYCVRDEFAELETFLNKRSDLDFVRQHWLSLYRFFCYRWNYDRISDGYKPEFLLKWQEEMEADEKRGLINIDDYPEEFRGQVERMRGDKEGYFVSAMYEVWNRRMIRNGFAKSLSEHTKIFVYGAGKVGNEVVQILGKYGVRPERILVKEKSENPQAVCGIPVASYQEKEMDREGAIVLVAIGQKNLYEACYDLHAAGYTNVLPMTGELRRTLAEQE